MQSARSCALLASAVLLLSAPPNVHAECEIPRNGTRAEVCAYVRAPANEWCARVESRLECTANGRLAAPAARVPRLSRAAQLSSRLV